MAKKTNEKKKMNIWNYIVPIIIVAFGVLYMWSVSKRIENGYFESAAWIAFNSMFYIVFFGLVTGYILSMLISKTSHGNGNNH